MEQAGEDLNESQTPDARLAEALRPTVTDALRRSIRDEPRVWAEVFFPILLPAIRMAVTSALRDMLASLNQILERSLSLQSWRWRFEAWRTGKPFAEVVLLRTLVYRVEQILLVDRHTGLLLASVAADAITPKDTVLVSAMLTALQDFISDSFEVDRNAGIRELYVGDFSLVVEQGSRAALAAAVRGNAPVELRETFRAAIDLIHQEFGTALRDFRGDPKPFERTRTILEGCLQSQYNRPRNPRNTWLWAATAAMVLALAVWLGFRVVEGRRWDRAVAAVRNTHGISVTLSNRQFGHYTLEGLRDPLATSPETLLANHGIDVRKVSLRFRPFLSLEPDLVVKRARAVLDAPPSVSPSLDQGILRLTGTASHAWILKARNAGPELVLTGIRKVQTGGLIDTDLEALRAEIETTRVLFATGSSVIAPEQAQVAKVLADRIQRWIQGARMIGRKPRLDLTGYSDRTGSEPTNLPLSRARAERVAEFLAGQGIGREWLVVRGGGESTDNSADAAHQRTVMIRANAGQG